MAVSYAASAFVRRPFSSLLLDDYVFYAFVVIFSRLICGLLLDGGLYFNIH